MALTVAINGYGRIARNVLRALYGAKRTNNNRAAGRNDLGARHCRHQRTSSGTSQGKCPVELRVQGAAPAGDGERTNACAGRDPAKLPWKELGADIVLECTGRFTSKAKASAPSAAGA